MRADTPPKHVRREQLQRDARCRAYGYETFQAYLRSSAYRETIRRYRASDRPQDCITCGQPDAPIRHLTYERICGHEHLDDVRPFCAACHHRLAVLQRCDPTAAPELQTLTDPHQADLLAHQLVHMTPPTRTESELATFHQLALEQRLGRLITLPDRHRATVRRDLSQIATLIRTAHTRRRPLPRIQLDRRAWHAAEALLHRQPDVTHHLLTVAERDAIKQARTLPRRHGALV